MTRAKDNASAAVAAAPLFVFLALLLAPAHAFAWGANAQRLIANRAVDTLPPELQTFFDANREFLLRHVTDPLGWLEKTPATERPNHTLYLDHYGKFPFDSLPREYQSALAKFGRTKLLANGVLPWQIGVYSQRLTEAMHNGNWGQAKLVAALLASYVAESHDPFLTTENFDGHLSGQTGINLRFGVSLVDRYSLFFPMRPNDAIYIDDPTDARVRRLPERAFLARKHSARRPPRPRRPERLHRRLLRPLLQSSWRHADSPALRRVDRRRLLLAHGVD